MTKKIERKKMVILITNVSNDDENEMMIAEHQTIEKEDE